jgi:leader peptidase (prepilin peptidase)/N-methyltransferase
MTAVAVVVSLLVGLVAGVLVQRAAARFVPAVPVAVTAGGPAAGEGDPEPRSVSVRVPPALTVAATAVLCGLAALRFGPTWQLPAFLLLAVVGVLLAVVDLEHRLLPNRIVVPATAGALALLVPAAAVGHGWTHLRNGILGAVVLFVLFLVLALVTPSGLGMGDVKLSAWLGLHLGWIGMGAVAVGAVAGFVVQAVLALVLLAARQVGVKGEIPFGPALLAGSALAIGGSHWIAGFLGATGKG